MNPPHSSFGVPTLLDHSISRNNNKNNNNEGGVRPTEFHPSHDAAFTFGHPVVASSSHAFPGGGSPSNRITTMMRMMNNNNEDLSQLPGLQTRVRRHVDAVIRCLPTQLSQAYLEAVERDADLVNTETDARTL